jgi:aspartate kinase
MIVMKFGGTSVGSPQRMFEVAELIRDEQAKIVVLSAVSGTTNRLVELGNLLFNSKKIEAQQNLADFKTYYYNFVDKLYQSNDFKQKGKELIDSYFDYMHSFTLDMFTIYEERALLAQGELISTNLFTLYLKEQNINAKLIPALDFMRINEDAEPQMDYIEENLGNILKDNQGVTIFITQGFICRNSFGEIDNLKRGGSDYTASLVGAAINADEIQIWTDIDGMHNNDPRIVEKTFPIRELSFNEAAELAYFGAKILHPSSVWPAQKKNIPVRLKNTMQPDAFGTLISSNTVKGKVKAVAAKDGITAIKIKSGRMLLAYGFLRSVFEVFERFKTPIDMITTSEVAVSLTIDDSKNLDDITLALQQFGEVEIDTNQTIVCIVGDFVADNKGYASMIFDALRNIPIRMISYGGSKNNVSLLVAEEHKVEVLKLLNDNIFN